MVDISLEEGKIIVIMGGGTSSWELVPQSSVSREEAIQVKVICHTVEYRGYEGGLLKCE